MTLGFHLYLKCLSRFIGLPKKQFLIENVVLFFSWKPYITRHEGLSEALRFESRFALPRDLK